MLVNNLILLQYYHTFVHAHENLKTKQKKYDE